MLISDWSSDVCSSDLVETDVVEDRAADDVILARRIDRIEAHRAQHVPRRGRALIVHSRIAVARGVAAIGEVEDFAHQRLRLPRSEEHTSELQSLMRTSYAVFCLKKKHK